MTKSRKQRLHRIERSFEVLWCAVMDLRNARNDHTSDFYQAAGEALGYLRALAKKAK